ncbi:hypothetical protein [Bacillus sp. Marseille-P3661]|uniref:hypothetical protein n=1 Tax=Bacillus sp. Marseille-P3661 TaxID=1936234 RepID=UPI000C83A208|nr:hypothetical protein [Bacillus sp. Marseille-P3661]
MNSKDIEKKIIENYQTDEKMMILVYAQWCINNELDPEELYNRAYPPQQANSALRQALDVVVSKEESAEIHDETLLNLLSVFGNDDLAFVVMEELEKK